MAREPNAIDFWRGFALVSIFVNHIPGLFFERFTHRNVSISDAADLFVFLAGWSLRYLVGSEGREKPARELVMRLGGRALQLYAAQILIVTIAIAMLGGAAVALRNPLLLEWHNAQAVFFDPVETHVGLAILTHHLGYFDILPLYVVLMMLAPAIALVDRYAPHVLLPLAFSVYAIVLGFRLTLPSWPVAGQWFFNPLAWQLIFVLGFVLANPQGLGAFVRRNIMWLRLAAIPFVTMGALMMQLDWWPDPTRVPEPRLFFIADKSFMTPIRLIQFLALIALFSAVYPFIQAAVPGVVAFLSLLGRNSLPVFCIASLLSLAGQIARFTFKGDIAVDTVMVVFGIATMALTAWLAEWREQKRS